MITIFNCNEKLWKTNYNIGTIYIYHVSNFQIQIRYISQDKNDKSDTE
jgi:hypothetical protein